MTKSEYLDMRGFSEQDYALMTAEECKHLIGQSGHMNNMYATNDPKGKTFGAGAYVVKRSWADQFQGTPDLQSEKPQPKVEELENKTVPPPPNPPAPPQTIEVEAEIEQEEEFVISSLLAIRIANLQKRGWVDEPQAKWLTFGDETMPYEELEALATTDYTKLIVVQQEPVKEPEVKKEFLCLNANQYGPEKQCAAQCGYCETQDSKPEFDTPEEDVISDETDVVIEVNSEEEIAETIEELKIPKTLDDIRKEEKLKEGAAAIAEKIVVGKTDDLEIDEANSEKKEEIKTPDGFIPGIKDEMTTGDVTGFFSQLAVIGFQQLNLTINKIAEGKLTVIVKPQNFSGDPAYDSIAPLVLSGTIDELDKEFFNSIKQPLKEVNGLMSNAEQFLKDAKKKEKETKEQEAKKAEVKKLVDAAKKFHTDDKEFDFKKSGTSAKKKWDKVIALDADNVDAKKGIAALEALANKEDSTLNLE